MKYIFGVSFALLFCSMVAGGLYLTQRLEEAARSGRDSAGELSALKEDFEALQTETRELKEELGRLESALDSHSAAAEQPLPPVPELPPSALAGAGPGEIKAYVAAILEEDRKRREDERKKEREQFRQWSEEKKKERAALSEGPYERFNLKVNSMAGVLAFNDEQKQAYYELLKRSREEYQQSRRRDDPAGKQAGPGRSGKGPGREERAKSRQVYEEVQNRFAAVMQAMLSQSQWEVYQQLSDSSRSFQELGQVSPPGEGGGRFAGGFQGKSGGPRRR